MNSLQLSVLLNAVDRLSAPMRNASSATSELAKSLKTNQQALFNLNRQQNINAKAIENYRNTLNPLKNKLGETNVALEKAKQQAKFFEQQLKNAKNPTEQFKAKVASAKATVNQLKNEQTKLANKLKATRAEFQKNGISAQTLAQKEQELKTKTKSATAEFEKQRAALVRLNEKQKQQQVYQNRVEKLKDISGRMQMVGAQTMAAGATVSTPVVNAVKDFASFEDVMAGVARQVQGLKDENGNFTKEYDVWANKIRALSKELPLTTNQIGDMVTASARMDIVKEEIEEFILLNTQMATAFDATNPDELVEKFGKVSKNFKLSQEATRELADTINYLDDNAISKGTGIIGFMNRVAGISAVAKISAKNMAALGSTLQTLGAGEEDSATAVSTIFTRLGVAGNHSQVDGGLKMLGLNPKKIAKGMAEDAQATLMLIVDKIKALSDDKQATVMKGLVGVPHVQTMAKLVKNTEEWRRQIELANSEAAKGSMAREFQTRMTTLSSKWIIFTNRLFNVNSVLGGSLKETLVGIMDSLGNVLDNVMAWTNANPELTATIMKAVAGGGLLLTTLGGLMMGASFIVYPILRFSLAITKIITVFGKLLPIIRSVSTALLVVGRTVFPILIAGIRALTAAFLANPIGLAITLITTAIYLLWQNWDTVVQWFKTSFSKCSEWASGLVDYFGTELPAKFTEWGKNMLNNLIDGIKNAWTSAKETVKNLGAQIGNSISSRWDKFKNALGFGTADNSTMQSKATGGYTGNGGRFDPAGIVHRGEFVFNKSATSRLGTGFLNTLHNAKSARAGMLAVGLASSTFATAQPIKIDNRPPLTARQTANLAPQAPAPINITINAAKGQDEHAIAREVARQLAQIQQRERARQNSALYDR